MQREFADDSIALHTDLYQINMAQTYWEDNIHNKKAVFEVFFRKLPFGNGYGIFAGLERVIEYIENFRFTDSDLQYLKNELNYEEGFLEYLKNMRFSGTIKSMEEGELVFGNEPILRVEAPLAEAQIIETAILNIINYQTLIATKATRIREVIGDGTAMEFGSRRAHEMDAAIWGTRAAYIGGFDATSNVRAAFKKYAQTHKDCVFLVDTYDTLKSGVPNAIKVAKEMQGQINFKGIRLDSGDLAYLSKKARKMLDDAGFPEAKIIASNDLDEYTIINLKAQGAKIDIWGIGTKLITAYEQAALGAVYKLVSIEDENGKMADTIKISGNPEKVTTPGLKRVYRIINRDNHKSEGDYIALDHENPQAEPKLKMFHPVHTFISKFVTNFEARELHKVIFQEGKLTYKIPSLKDMQSFAKDNLNVLWDEYRRSLNPEEYPVDLSQECWDNKMKMISQVKENIKG
jgi:nicotinate phosphoribosyltransferase